MKKLYFLEIFIILIVYQNNSFSQNDLSTGIFWGYQGWHLTPGDQRLEGGNDRWDHWFDSPRTDPSPSKYGIEMHPDVSEYVKLYDTDMVFDNGKTVQLYSCFDYETVDTHIKWMKEYGIKGIFLQRQQLNIRNANQREFRDKVLEHVMTACNIYGIKFCLMLANNNKQGQDGSSIRPEIELFNNFKTDYNYLTNKYPNLWNNNMYAQQDDKPVVGIWGLGFSNRNITPQEGLDLINFFKDENFYVMGGVPPSWRSNPKTGWSTVFTQLDMVSPWRTLLPGQGTTDMTTKIATLKEDLAYCNTNNLDYNPVVTPGASSATQSATGGDGSYHNWQPRDGGNLLWKQIYEAYNAGAKFIYGAMFDEVDEATAIYKMAKSKDEIPINTSHNGNPFTAVTLDEDIDPTTGNNYALPNDWYLQLAGRSDEMKPNPDGSLSENLTINIPIKAYLDVCDDVEGWTSTGTEFNRFLSDKKQGSASLRFKGDQTVEFSKVFSPAVETEISETYGMLKFYYFVGNVNRYIDYINIDLSSGVGAANNSITWQIPKSELQNGWNAISLKISDANSANSTDTINMNAINFFSIHAPKTGEFVTRLDGLRLIDYYYSGAPNTLSNNTFFNSKIENSNEIIYPNPFRNTISLSSDKVIKAISITNLLGKRVVQLNINAPKKDLDLANLKSGLYIISLRYNDGTESKNKIIKLK
ncbi:MAG: T9SS type A sorting domain-containing protein [Polaribacter sp.]